MTQAQRIALKAYAVAGMNVRAAAKNEHFHHNNITYHLDRIHEQTGLDPRNLFDLSRLYEMARVEEMDMPKMTERQALDYLQPIADNAQIAGYQEALSVALDALREVGELRARLRKYEEVGTLSVDG